VHQLVNKNFDNIKMHGTTVKKDYIYMYLYSNRSICRATCSDQVYAIFRPIPKIKTITIWFKSVFKWTAILTYWLFHNTCCICTQNEIFLNPLNPELNPICCLLALLGAHHFLHVNRIRVKLLTFRLLMSYIWSTQSWCF